MVPGRKFAIALGQWHTRIYLLPKWGVYGSDARMYLGVSSSSKRWVTSPGQFCKRMGWASFSIPSKRLAILSFLRKKMLHQTYWLWNQKVLIKLKKQVKQMTWVICVLVNTQIKIQSYLFISKVSCCFGSKSFLNSETKNKIPQILEISKLSTLVNRKSDFHKIVSQND